MTSKPVLPLFAACALCAMPSFANDRLEEVIVTSSRVPTPLRQVGTSVSVITADEIQSLGFLSLQDVLRTLPGVGVNNSGGAGKVSTLRIRGEEGYRTRVYLDGIDISDPSSPQPSPRFEQLLSSGVSRVEVLRGPQGMVYGADAGGVVNITTRAPGDGFNGDVSAEGGRYDTRQLATNLAYGSDTLGGVLSVADFSTDGFNARADDTDPGDDDGYDNTTVHGRLDWKPTDDIALTLVGRDVDGNNEYDNCGYPSTNNCSDDYKLQAWRGAASWQGDVLSHELSYSTSDTQRVLYTDGARSYEYEGEIDKWSYVAQLDFAEALHLVYGVDLQSDALDSEGERHSRDDDGYFVEYQGTWFDNLYLTAGARYDDNEDFGSYTSYRASGAYVIPVRGGDFKLRATWGTGFRAPSLYEIAYNDGPWAYPPAAGTGLDAEESEGYDLGVSWFGGNGLYLEAVYFDQRIDKEIFFDLASYSGYLQDRGESKSTGVELIGELAMAWGFSAKANYTYNDTETAGGDQRYYRPKHLANLGLDWVGLAERLHLGIAARLSRDAVDTTGAEVDDYGVVSLYSSFTVLQGLDVYARVENLLDEDYQEAPPYNTSGAAAYAGVRYSF